MNIKNIHLYYLALLVKQLGVAFLMFSVCRLLFYFFNKSYFHDVVLMDFIYGLRFDASAIAYTYSPFVILHTFPVHLRHRKGFRQLLKVLFYLATFTCITLNALDFEYFKFTNKRSTADLFRFVGLGDDLLEILPAYIANYWHVAVVWIGLLYTVHLLYEAVDPKEYPISSGIKYYLIQVVLLIIILPVFVIMARGGLQLRPIGIIHAGESSSVKKIPLILNTPFSIIRTLYSEGIEVKNYFTSDELEKIYTPKHQYNDPSYSYKPNIVIIILESFSKEYIGGLNNVHGYTPFLDSLIKKSLAFDSCFANAKKSIEGIPAVLASIPALINSPYILSAYSGNQINSVATALKTEGYHTSFFHGGNNGTMGFDAFCKTAGFDHYIGRNEYPDSLRDLHYDGTWGIYDEEFFQYFAQKTDEYPKPFMSCIFTLSSHQPYSIPEKHAGTFKATEPEILRSVEYTDYSLRKYFESVSQKPWFDSTLFVFTADHSSVAIESAYQTNTGSYAVPLVFYRRNSSLQGMSHRITQQTDIMPSVLHYAGYNKPFVAFGESVFDQSVEGFSVSFLNNLYQLVKGSYALQFDGTQSVTLYHLPTDNLLQKNILNEQPETAKAMEVRLKAIVQSYNSRVFDNRMMPD